MRDPLKIMFVEKILPNEHHNYWIFENIKTMEWKKILALNKRVYFLSTYLRRYEAVSRHVKCIVPNKNTNSSQ